MKFRERFRPELGVIGRGNHRPHLEHVWLDVDGKRLAATNGHLIVVVPCEVEDGDVSGFITVDAIEYARANRDDNDYDYVRLRCGERAEWRGGSFERPKTERPFPPIDEVFAAQKPGDPGTVTLALDARYLRRLVGALGGADEERGGPAHARLVIKLPANPGDPMLDPIAVVDNDDGDQGDAATAALMPCRPVVAAPLAAPAPEIVP